MASPDSEPVSRFPFAGSKAPLVIASRWRTRVGKRREETLDDWSDRLNDLVRRMREHFPTERPIDIASRRVSLTFEGPQLVEDPPRRWTGEYELVKSDLTGWCWTERPGVTSEDVRIGGDALSSGLKLASRHLGPDYGDFKITSEQFVSLVVPPGSIDRGRVVASVGFEPAGLRGERLDVGPRAGAIEAVEGLLRSHEQERARERRARRLDAKPADRRRLLYPLALAATLLLTWAAPIDGWAAVLALALVTAFFGVAVTHLLIGYEGRWSDRLTRGPVVASAGLTGILGFGIVYAVIALAQEDGLGEDAIRLGDAFLISTSLGVAGGLIGGDLKIAARIVAHIQLLLFLGGLVAAAIAFLRLLERTGGRE